MATQGWAAKWWRALAAELAGTALLVGLGVATLMPWRGMDAIQLTHPALAFGGVVAALAAALGPASGAHLNPSVTLAAALTGRLAPLPALAYLAAQLAGATLGFGALLGVARGAIGEAPAGCTLVPEGVAPGAAAAVEAALTAVLALTCCALWERDAGGSAPLTVGLVVAGLVYSGGFASSASINPARSFAPALLHNVWTDHWVYWVGPLSGAALAAVFHRFVLVAPKPRRAEPADPEDLPLNDKP